MRFFYIKINPFREFYSRQSSKMKIQGDVLSRSLSNVFVYFFEEISFYYFLVG